MPNNENHKPLKKHLTVYERVGGNYGDFMRAIEKKRKLEAEDADVEEPHEAITPKAPDSKTNSEQSAKVKRLR